MTIAKETVCLSALGKLFLKCFNQDEFSLNGPKECAVCLEKTASGWQVYEKEKESYNNLIIFDNLIEACLNMIERMTSNNVELKNIFLDMVISEKIT